jgi:hypothetical protein
VNGGNSQQALRVDNAVRKRRHDSADIRQLVTPNSNTDFLDNRLE